jgi:hypothetical protein
MDNIDISNESSHSTREGKMPEKTFLEKHSDGGECPFGCGQHYVHGKDLLSHVFNQIEQTDQHLLDAARAGLFALDFAKLSISDADASSEQTTNNVEDQEFDGPVSDHISADAPSNNIVTYSADTAGTAERMLVLCQRLKDLGWVQAPDEQDGEVSNGQRLAQHQAQALQSQDLQQTRNQQVQTFDQALRQRVRTIWEARALQDQTQQQTQAMQQTQALQQTQAQRQFQAL